MHFAQYNSALMVFRLWNSVFWYSFYLLGILDVYDVGTLIFFLCTGVSIMPLL